MNGRALHEQSSANAGASLVDRIFLLVTRAIQTRQLPAGVRMPSVRQLADDCQVSRDTVARAYDKLVAHGVLQARRGSGFYVRAGQRPMSSAEAARQVAVGGPSNAGTRWCSRLLNAASALLSRPGSGLLPADWLDDAALNSALRAVGRTGHRALARYNDLQGYLPLRQQLQLKLRELDVRVDPCSLICTAGAAEALHLVAQAYLRRPGEYVLLEQPGPPLLGERLLSVGMYFAYVPRRHDGPDLDVMRDLCKRHRPRFFFCSSVLHNPTCSSIAPHKAFQLLRLAEEFDLTIVEDDTYGDLMPPSGFATSTRLASLDQLKRVIYIGSFSKTLAPDFRCGFLAANAERVEWLVTYRMLSCIASPSLGERVVHRLLAQGGYRHRCEQLRQRLDEARPLAAAQLAAHGLDVADVPDAGMYLWAAVPDGRDVEPIATRLYDAGHLLAPASLFSQDPKFRSYLRFNIAETVNSPALPVLAKALRS